MPTNKKQQTIDSEAYATWFLVGRTFHKCERALTAALEELELSVAQHDLLATIDRYPGASQNEIAQRLFVVKSNVSNLIKKLERRALVERKSSLTDSRSKLLILTRKGEALLHEANQRQSRVIEHMLSVLSERDIRQTRRIMERVNQALSILI